MKRWLEDKVAEIAEKSGYAWDFIMDIVMDLIESDGEVDWNYVEAVSMEHDW